MRIAVITFSNAFNYGATLQMYALQKKLKTLGAETFVIDYRSPSVSKSYKKNSFRSFFKIKNLYHIIFHNTYRKYYEDGFAHFWEDNIKFTYKTYYSFDELKTLEDEFDCFISGSDQVFNLRCSGNDYHYFLDFVSEKNKKYSYAASLGITHFNEDNIDIYRKLLSSFKEISFREKISMDLVNKNLKINGTYHIDPTLLLTGSEWRSISSNTLCCKEKYILIYLISEDREIFKFARKLAKRENYKIMYVNDRLFKKTRMRNLRRVDPSQWIGLIDGASAVVTNSYHGLLFSLNLGKRVYPFYLKTNKEVNSRFDDFSNNFNLEYLFSDEYRESINPDIWNKKINEFYNRLTNEKQRSNDYLMGLMHK